MKAESVNVLVEKKLTFNEGNVMMAAFGNSNVVLGHPLPKSRRQDNLVVC